MKSQDDNKLYTAVIRKSRHNVIIAFAITSMDFTETLERMRRSLKQDTEGPIAASEMVLVSQGLKIEQYKGFTKYAHDKFDHHDVTVRDLQDLWVTYAKEHGFSRPEDTAYASNDGTNQYQSAKPGQSTNTNTTPNAGTDAALPNTAKDDSHPIHDDVYVPYDLNVSGIYINNALGITDQRLEELAKPLHEIIKDEFEKGEKSPEQGANIAAILSRASKVAKTHAELLYIGYLAGANIEHWRGEVGGDGGRHKDLDTIMDLIGSLGKLHDLKKKYGMKDDSFSFAASDAAKKAAQN